MLDFSYNQIKIGCFTPLILEALGTGAANVKVIKTAKYENAEEAEAKRHNTEMEKIAQSKKTLSLDSGIKKMIKTLVTLTKSQIKKNKDSYKTQKPVRIRLSYKQIAGKGKHKILLTDTQKISVNKSRKLKKGVTLDLSYNQIKILAALGAVGTLAGGGTAIANAVKTAKHQNAEEAEAKRHNVEMEKIAQSKKILSLGSGIKKKTKSCR